MKLERSLNLLKLLDKKSHFLFGARGTGKSTLARSQLPDAQYIDLLDESVFARLLRNPSQIEELVSSDSSHVVIDEVQRIPALLNHVHRMIENHSKRFLLTGSSARKLKHGAANLLAGRAWEARLLPLTWRELGQNFDLIKYLNRGGLPVPYFSDHPVDELRNYVNLYLKEEIQAESIVKRLDHFARFLDVAAVCNLEELNYESIGNDSGVPSRTVASFFEVLEDTLIGFQLRSFQKTSVRKAIKRSKFIIFDVGVAGAMARRGEIVAGSELWGKAFEHFIIQEVRAYISYSNHPDTPMQYWRSTTQSEVDLIVGERVAIEIKASERISNQHLKGLSALMEEGLLDRFILVSNDPIVRKSGKIEIMPYQTFLAELWDGRIV
jgi:predicted AAA+ superfamily ATPase